MRQNVYTRFKQQQNAETDDFCRKYCEWAFGQEQFKKLLDKLKLTEEQLKEKYQRFIGGGIILRDKVDDWNKLCDRHEEALKKKLFSNKTFAYAAFMYEFNNYECGYTGSYNRALNALGLDLDDIIESPKLLEAYNKATKTYGKWCDKHIW